MDLTCDIQLILVRIGDVDTDALHAAMDDEGWGVETVETLEHLLALIDTGRHHAVVVAAEDPWQLPKTAMRSLMGFQGSMALFFLVPDRGEVMGCPALIGTTSEQVHSLDTPPKELIQIFHSELLAVVVNHPEYTVACVDDDEDFLASLEHFLPRRIEEAFPRFVLDFEFFASPLEALEAAEGMADDRLAVVISDQIMPEMKGVELLVRLKQIRPNAQRVLLTGHAGLEAAIQAINDRALDKYFTKPIEQSADFIQTIRHLLRSYHLHLSGDALRHRLMAQFEFIRLVTAAHSLEKVLEATALFVQEQLDAVGVAVMLLEEGGLEVRAVEGRLPGLPVETCLKPEEALGSWVLKHRQPILAGGPEDLPPGVDLDLDVPLPVMVVPLVWGEAPVGVLLAAGRQGPHPRPFGRDERMLMSFIADAGSVTIGGLRDREAIEQYYVSTMASLMETVEAKDIYTRGHTDRVMDLAMRLARAAAMESQDLTDVARAAALHDIGKIAVPEWIITKPGPLDAEESALMRLHCERGARIVSHLDFLDGARRVIESHHERWDGKGYPNGLAGEAIPLGARVLAIVDSYDAMTSDRPYRRAMDVEEALSEIEANAGGQFDPELVRIFVGFMREPSGMRCELATAGPQAAAGPDLASPR